MSADKHAMKGRYHTDSLFKILDHIDKLLSEGEGAELTFNLDNYDLLSIRNSVVFALSQHVEIENDPLRRVRARIYAESCPCPKCRAQAEKDAVN